MLQRPLHDGRAHGVFPPQAWLRGGTSSTLRDGRDSVWMELRQKEGVWPWISTSNLQKEEGHTRTKRFRVSGSQPHTSRLPRLLARNAAVRSSCAVIGPLVVQFRTAGLFGPSHPSTAPPVARQTSVRKNALPAEPRSRNKSRAPLLLLPTARLKNPLGSHACPQFLAQSRSG